MTPAAPEFVGGRPHEDPIQPGIEALDVAQLGQLSPAADEGFLVRASARSGSRRTSRAIAWRRSTSAAAGQRHWLATAGSFDNLAHRHDPRVHILGHHVRIAAVDAVVEVVPHPTVTHGAADHAGQQRHAVGDQKSAWFGQQGEFVAPVAENIIDDGGERSPMTHCRGT